MSNITQDFHTICRGIDCDLDNRWNGCNSVELEVMSKYSISSIKNRLRKSFSQSLKLKKSFCLILFWMMSRMSAMFCHLLMHRRFSVDIPSACFNFSKIDQQMNSKLSKVNDELSD